MCTAITMKTAGGTLLFGRTMDFSFELDPQLYVVPENYRWNNATDTVSFQNQYSFIGIGQEIPQLTFADGVNEMGFAAAVLYFPGYARYSSLEETAAAGRSPVAAVELVHFLLGSCGSVEDAAQMLDSIEIVGVKDSITQSVAPLHWIMADESGDCAVIEQTDRGLQLFDNPLGVLANSPDFVWQMTNLRNYMNLSQKQVPTARWGEVSLAPFGQGGGSLGLPGDFTPPSRFVRAAFLKSHVNVPADAGEAAVAGFHVLESVSIPKGVVRTAIGTVDYTQYTAFMDTASRTYYVKTYDGGCVSVAALPSNEEIGEFPMSLGRLKKGWEFRGEWDSEGGRSARLQ